MGVWGKPGGETTISGPPPLSFAACRYRVEQGRGGGATDARAKRREARNLPEAGSRGVLWADGAPGAGLAARPQQCAFGAQRGPEPANGGRSGAAYLGQSPGASARAGRRGKSSRAFCGVGAKPRAAPRARRAKGVAALLAVGSEAA